MTERLVFGIGTGRTGSLALATLLNQQPGVAMHHELRPLDGDDRLGERSVDPLPWDVDIDHARRAVGMLSAGSAAIGGDVAAYWLPYVELILGEIHPDSRFIVMRRARDEVVESFMRKAPTKNHWMDHDGSEFELIPQWDRSFPKYDVATKREALESYWDEYDRRTRELAAAHPDRVRVWDFAAALNTAAGVAGLLDFAGIEAADRNLQVGVNRNRSQRRLGQYLRMWWRRLGPR